MNKLSWTMVVVMLSFSNGILANSLLVNLGSGSQEQRNNPFKSNRAFGTTQTTKYDINRIITEEAKRNKVSADLIHAIIKVESAYNVRAVSSKGAMGLMQLIPGTAQRFGVKNAFNARDNIQGGVRYLKFLLNRFDKLEYAIAGYNAGEGAVQKYNGIPPYKETKNYVKKVLKIYQKRLNLKRQS